MGMGASTGWGCPFLVAVRHQLGGGGKSPFVKKVKK